jgi:hypothetical protein
MFLTFFPFVVFIRRQNNNDDIQISRHSLASCLFFSFLCVADQGEIGEGAKIIRRRECLVLYKSFDTLRLQNNHEHIVSNICR